MRISPKIVRRAWKSSPQVASLLRAAGGLEAAENELRWIKNELPKDQWNNAIARRSLLEPLQYILGSQPFGNLEIGCEPGVLIPRWETEEWTMKIIDILRNYPSLKSVDACTGTGCIPLLMKHELPNWTVGAFDISEKAVQLAKRNSDAVQCNITVKQGDLFDEKIWKSWAGVDLVTANPPYIPEQDYEKPLALDGPEKSVRKYEPRLALVGHVEVYSALIKNLVVPLGCRGFIFELGYEDQVTVVEKLLPEEWKCVRYFDSAERLRCVIGWKRNTDMAVLEELAVLKELL